MEPGHLTPESSSSSSTRAAAQDRRAGISWSARSGRRLCPIALPESLSDFFPFPIAKTHLYSLEMLRESLCDRISTICSRHTSTKRRMTYSSSSRPVIFSNSAGVGRMMSTYIPRTEIAGVTTNNSTV